MTTLYLATDDGPVVITRHSDKWRAHRAAPSVQVALPALQQTRFSPPAPSVEWDNRESGALMMLAVNGIRFSRGFRVTTLPQWP